jgi:hypothetical protein
MVGRFALRVYRDLLESMKTSLFCELVSVKTHIGTIDVMSEPQHAA